MYRATPMATATAIAAIWNPLDASTIAGPANRKPPTKIPTNTVIIKFLLRSQMTPITMPQIIMYPQPSPN